MRIETIDGAHFVIHATHKELTKMQVCWDRIREPRTPKEKKYGIAVIGAFFKMVSKAKLEGAAGNEGKEKA